MKKRIKFRFLRELFDFNDEQQDQLDTAVAQSLAVAEGKRYHEPRNKYRKSRHFIFEEDMNDDVHADGEMPWLTDREFLSKYRCSRASVNALYDLIKDDPVFVGHNKIGRKQIDAKSQLLVLLRFLGTEGSGGSNNNLRNVFGIGEGTANLYRDRVVAALLNLKSSVITWPNAQEREQISNRFSETSKFRNCVGVMDGTLFPLAFRPQSKDAPDYSGRKHAYSISALIICDDKRRIRYINAGWPGTAHDNRILRNSNIFQRPLQFFAERQYILGDSAFENTWFVVSAFKKPRGSSLPREQELFNDALSKPRVVSEHTIGILKGRFPWLRQIRNVVTDDPKHMKKILDYILAASILHNLLLDCSIPEEWMDTDDMSAIDDPDRSANDELDVAVPLGSANDLRRQQLMHYFNEFHVIE